MASRRLRIGIINLGMGSAFTGADEKVPDLFEVVAVCNHHPRQKLHTFARLLGSNPVKFSTTPCASGDA